MVEISAPHWNQDEEFGGFGGPHAMVPGGFDQAFRALAGTVQDLRLNAAVTAIDLSEKEDRAVVTYEASDDASVSPASQSVACDLVIVTVPLGVLKQNAISFTPALPPWKTEAIGRLGFGCLNKVVLRFPSIFWDNSLDYFGAVQPAGEASRGQAFMFWNLARHNGGVPILVALVSGAAARALEVGEAEGMTGSSGDGSKAATDANVDNNSKSHTSAASGAVAGALRALRNIFGQDAVPGPSATAVTRWASDPAARGSYSFVAVGASGRDYDVLALPVRRRVLFAGEHTARAHPDTVGGAMLSGLREAVRALEIFDGRGSDEADGDAVAGGYMSDADGQRGTKRASRGGSWRWRWATAVARREEQLRLREAARHEQKELWRAVMLAGGSGQVAPLLGLLEGAGGTAARLALAQTLRTADAAGAGRARAQPGPGDAIALETFESYAAGKRSDDRRGGKGAGKHRKPSKPEPTDVPGVVESGARATIELLKPLFKRGHISKEQYKSVARKAVQRLASEPVAQGQVPLNDKRRQKIVELVNKYVARLGA
ncbi:hypothetical protein QBZ16_005349 [Prototheca wickerhamii]|uniref:Amine oxidase domain-containing protein n=1 Tax=Prototheca wickerhamii TaxID=3111 RepID=A0AAD9MGD3_PROWI|nr:hypothetical protein QBZ16_005349 [Prototheca wickerhamii]